VVVQRERPPRCGGALDEQLHRLRLGQWRHLPDLLTDDTQRCAARGQNAEVWTPAQQPVNERSDRRNQVLGVIEHQQQLEWRKLLDERFDQWVLGLLAQTGGRGDRIRHHRGRHN
jgi:hypothetical protein